MFHKLWLTSLLNFFPIAAQLPLGMVIVCLHTIAILSKEPYVRTTDERLHLLAQVDLFLFMLSGYVFQIGETLDTGSDVLMSIFLLFVTFFFLAAFIYQVWYKLQAAYKNLTGAFLTRDREDDTEREKETQKRDEETRAELASMKAAHHRTNSGKLRPPSINMGSQEAQAQAQTTAKAKKGKAQDDAFDDNDDGIEMADVSITQSLRDQGQSPLAQAT